MTGARVPDRLPAMSRRPLRLLNFGVPLGPLVLLRTAGRRTGRPQTTPVAPIRDRGRRYLVAPFGETGWVRNARVQPRAELGRGRRMRAVRLTEVGGPERARVLHHYARHYALVPFVRQAFAARPRHGVAAFDAEADQHPVFAVADAEPEREG